MTLRKRIAVIISGLIIISSLIMYAVTRLALGSSISGQVSIKFFIIITTHIFTGLAIIAAVLFIIEKLVLSRLLRLGSCISSIGASGNPATKVAVTGRDELAKLAEEINKMLAALEQAQGELRQEKKLYRNLADKLRTAHEQLLAIIEFLPDATFVIDHGGKVIAWNRAMEKLTGTSKQEIIGKSDYTYAVPFFGEPGPMLINLIRTDINGDELGYEQVEKKGNTLYAEVLAPCLYNGKGALLGMTASPLYDSDGRLVGAVSTIRDITEQKQAEEQLKFLSLHDPLTGLYNRMYFDQEMKRLAGEGNIKAGIIICDVDNLKVVNDTMGHDMGDKMLLAVAGIFKETLRKNDIVARIGGDEFAILLTNCSEAAVEHTCERIRGAIDRHNLANPEFPVNISIGFAACNKKVADLAELFRQADKNMYLDKQQRSHKFCAAVPGKSMG